MAAATEKKEAKKEMTKAEMVTALSEATQMTKTDVTTVIAELGNLIGKNVGKKGPGVFTLPGLLKIEVKVKPATKKRMGVNPRTGEPMEISAKPKMRVVRVRALKGLKDVIVPADSVDFFEPRFVFDGPRLLAVRWRFLNLARLLVRATGSWCRTEWCPP